MVESIIKDRSFKFALLMIDLYKKLTDQKEYIISKQLLRSGTSIGANIREALAAQSRRDFVHKMSIAAKEAQETNYWLELLAASKIVSLDYKVYVYESYEIIKILSKIIKTTTDSET